MVVSCRSAVQWLAILLTIHLVCDTLSNAHRRDSSRLGACDHLALQVGQVGVTHELRDLSCLSGTSLTFHNDDLIVVELRNIAKVRFSARQHDTQILE